jgi:hypothetical protein
MEDAMADEGMTAHELECSGHLKQARALGLSLAEYARAHGLKVRMLYDADNRLRKKGVTVDALSSQRLTKMSTEGNSEIGGSQFVAVRIDDAGVPASTFSAVLRVRHARGHILEFGSWPPADVMAAALLGGCDAAA